MQLFFKTMQKIHVLLYKIYKTMQEFQKSRFSKVHRINPAYWAQISDVCDFRRTEKQLNTVKAAIGLIPFGKLCFNTYIIYMIYISSLFGIYLFTYMINIIYQIMTLYFKAKYRKTVLRRFFL